MARGTQKLRNAQTQHSKLRSSEVQMYFARILIEDARFPPFGIDTEEIGSNMTENMSFLQKDLLCPDSHRERSVSPLRVGYSGDQL